MKTRKIIVTLEYETDQPLKLVKDLYWNSAQSKWERELKLICDKMSVQVKKVGKK